MCRASEKYFKPYLSLSYPYCHFVAVFIFWFPSDVEFLRRASRAENLLQKSQNFSSFWRFERFFIFSFLFFQLFLEKFYFFFEKI